MKRRIFSLMLVLVLTLSFSIAANAASFDDSSENENLPYAYTQTDGTVINYAIDSESGVTYTYVDGEMMFVMLPLPQYAVTDAETINMLDDSIDISGLPADNGIMTFGEPTSVDTNRLKILTDSTEYGENSCDLDNDAVYRTYFYKKATTQNYSAARLKTTVHGGGIFGSGVLANKKLKVTYYAQDVLGEWFSQTVTTDFTSPVGQGFLLVSTIEYFVFDVQRDGTLTSFDYVSWLSTGT